MRSSQIQTKRSTMLLVYPTISEFVRNYSGGGYTKMRVAVINYSK
jgi:hypothetical protein